MMEYALNNTNFTSTGGLNSSGQPHTPFSCFYVIYRRSAVDNFYNSYIFSIVLNSICAVPASVLNILVILAIWKKSQLHTPSNVLLSNLALTDFGIGFIVQPAFVAHKIAILTGNKRLHCIASLVSKTLASTLGVVSLTTLTAISIDRLLALVLSVRYRTVVTTPMAIKTVLVMWLIGVVLTIPLFIYPPGFVYCIIALLLLCLTVTTVAYAVLFKLIRQHQCKVGTELTTARGTRDIAMTNITKYKSSIRTVVCLTFLMLLFYSPYLISNIVLVVVKKSDDRFIAAFNITHSVLFVNSVVNPAFYCCKITSIRQAIKEIFYTCYE